MPNPLYNSVNYTATIKKTREFLADYHMWHVEAAHFSSWVKSPSNFGTPSYHSTENTVENRVVDQANAQFECELRTKTLEQLATVDNESALLSDLLLFRWINNWSVKKTCTELAEKYQRGFIAERTYANYLKKALWEFAVICPRDLFVQKS